MRDLGVLVVDDNIDMLQFIQKVFGLLKVKADYALSAPEALECLKSKNYRTMITDFEMPGINGLELARTAREQFPDLNVVLFTGNTSPDIQNLVSDAIVSEVHYKPSGLGGMLKSIINKENDNNKYEKI
jgi:CheY-like chemotaxis protein